MSKIVMLRLRNRILNRFKQLKKASPKQAKTIKKTITPSPLGFIRGGKTLRVVPKKLNWDLTTTNSTSVKVSPVKIAKPSSPTKSNIHKIGSSTMAALIGHRRLFLRNRRLMHLHNQNRVLAVSA